MYKLKVYGSMNYHGVKHTFATITLDKLCSSITISEAPPHIPLIHTFLSPLQR